MTLHFTYEGDSAEVEGRVFRFSKELGRRVGASKDMLGSLSRSPMSNDRTRRPTA